VSVVTVADVITDDLFLRLVDAVTVVLGGGVTLRLLPVTLHLVANHAAKYCAACGGRVLASTAAELMPDHAADHGAEQLAGDTIRILLRHFMHFRHLFAYLTRCRIRFP